MDELYDLDKETLHPLFFLDKEQRAASLKLAKEYTNAYKAGVRPYFGDFDSSQEQERLRAEKLWEEIVIPKLAEYQVTEKMVEMGVTAYWIRERQVKENTTAYWVQF